MIIPITWRIERYPGAIVNVRGICFKQDGLENMIATALKFSVVAFYYGGYLCPVQAKTIVREKQSGKNQYTVSIVIKFKKETDVDLFLNTLVK